MEDSKSLKNKVTGQLKKCGTFFQKQNNSKKIFLYINDVCGNWFCKKEYSFYISTNAKGNIIISVSKHFKPIEITERKIERFDNGFYLPK